MIGPIDIGALRRKHERFIRLQQESVSKAAHEAGQDAVNYVRSEPHFKPRTGKLQKLTEYRLIRTRTQRIVKVRNRAKYAAAIDSGSRPHTIAARRKKFLRFTVGGQVFFRKKVFHPGTKPTHFLYRANLHGYERLGHLLRETQSQIAKRF